MKMPGWFLEQRIPYAVEAAISDEPVELSEGCAGAMGCSVCQILYRSVEYCSWEFS
jgi:hypothetical protein